MKFRTADLITRIDALVAQREAEAAQKNAEAEKAQAAAVEQWVVKHQAAWSEFATKIRERVRTAKPVTLDDIPKALRDRYHHVAFFSSAATSKATANVESLKQLKVILQAVEDEYVTTSGLREIGFKDVAHLFRGAAG